ncbi:MAG: hypothetical protein H0X50_05470 [Nitrosopumilus sp.]|nr:hypothetical protein [Nitrosopumilus sp.]
MLLDLSLVISKFDNMKWCGREKETGNGGGDGRGRSKSKGRIKIISG